MRRVVVWGFGGADQLKVEPLDEPLRPLAGQVLIDVEAAGVNYIDVYQRKGIYKPQLRFTPGFEGVGRVLELGKRAEGVTGILEVGQRVGWINVLGSYASRLLIPVDQAIPVPDSFHQLPGAAVSGSDGGISGQ
jgi:NADPH:quinone reductase